MRRSTACVSCLAFAVLCGCKKEASPPPIAAAEYIQPDAPPVYAPPKGAAAGEVTFADITEHAGIRFTHITGAFGEKWMPETMGGGGGFFDYDNDGWADVLLVNSTYWPGHVASPLVGDADSAAAPPTRGGATPTPPVSRLYRNRRDGTFEDVTSATGLAEVSCYGMGFAAADYDGDGDPDVYITAVGKDRLLRNDEGKFTDVTDSASVGFSAAAGAAHPWEWSTGAAWLDNDRDGDLDLFVCNYVQWTPETDIWATLDGKTKSYSTPQPYQGASNAIFRNNGDSTFADVTKQVGVFNPEGKSLGVVTDDFNDDGWPDLFVSNDTQPNFLYINNQDGTFTDRALSAGVAYDEAGLTRAGMGVAVANLDNRGPKSIAIANFSGEPVSLYTQVAGDTFVERAGATRLSKPTTESLKFGLVFADFNLDGFEDLMLANGHIEPEIERVRENWTFAQRPQLFLNNRAGQFVETTDKAGPPLASKLVGRALATADIDHDGDLDVLITANGGSPKLLRNDQPRGANVVRIRLIGHGKNPDAIGASLRAEIGDAVQTRYITTGGSYLSQSELTATFGLAGEQAIRRLSVRWPRGSQTEFENLAAGKLHIIHRDNGLIRSESLRERP